MADHPALHDLAMLAGALPLGDAQYIFSAQELAELVRLAGGAWDLIALYDRLQKKGVSVELYVDIRH